MDRRMLYTIATISVLALTAAVFSAELIASPAEAATVNKSQVERGRYLVTIMSCNDCHTPFTMTERGPAPDMSRMLSGHPEQVRVTAPPKLEGSWGSAASQTNTAWAGPWGVSFTANLTPDPETGLGKWTAETFIAALRTGRHEGQGRPILPPMPYPFIGQATDADLRAIFAYLQSIPAIKNRVPQPIEPVAAN